MCKICDDMVRREIMPTFNYLREQMSKESRERSTKRAEELRQLLDGVTEDNKHGEVW